MSNGHGSNGHTNGHGVDADAAREDLKDVKVSFHDTLQVVLAGDGPSSSTAPATSRPTFALEEEEED